MAACKMPQRPTKAEEMEKLSEAALAFVKEGLNLEENNQETSVRILSRIQFVNPYFIENYFTSFRSPPIPNALKLMKSRQFFTHV